jgi:hypothetical protein
LHCPKIALEKVGGMKKKILLLTVFLLLFSVIGQARYDVTRFIQQARENRENVSQETTTETLGTNQETGENINSRSFLVEMAGRLSERESTTSSASTLSSPSTENPSETTANSQNGVLATETCNNGKGYSLGNQDLSFHEKYCVTGKPDCCGWYQYAHVHDLETMIQPPVAIYAQLRTGFSEGCEDTVKVYVSADNETWDFVGSIDTTSTDADGSPGYPEDWVSGTLAVQEHENPFRWVKIAASDPHENTGASRNFLLFPWVKTPGSNLLTNMESCYIDHSLIRVTGSVENQTPKARFDAPTNAPAETRVTFNASKSYDPDGNIVSYQWEFGDYTTEETSNPVITHTYEEPLNHWVNLVVTDNDGAMDSTMKKIVIKKAPDTTPPWSNHPPDQTVNEGASATINWVLYDNGKPGTYKVLKDNALEIPWTKWENGSDLAVPVDTDSQDHLLFYTIHFKDDAGNYGGTDTVKITIQTVNTPPTTPTPQEPAHQTQTSDTTPFFDWSQSTDGQGDAITYELKVDDNSNFGSPEIHETGLSQTSHTPGNELSLGTYYWKVRASDGTEYSGWSETWEFTIEPMQDTTPPRSNHPPNFQVQEGETATIDWILYDETAPGQYKVLKNNQEYVGWSEWENATLINTPVDTGETGTFTYKIKFKDQAENQGTPDEVTVTVNPEPQPPEKPVLIEPVNGQTTIDQTPFFDWSDSTDPDGNTVSYQLRVDDDPGFASPQISKNWLGLSQYQTSLSEQLSTGEYYWKVRAFDGTEYSPWTTAWHFTIQEKAVPTGELTQEPSETWTEEYPTQTTVSCSLTEGDSSTTLTLKRDGTVVGTGTSPSETITLNAGTYSYSCHYPETENYQETVLDAQTLTINKASRSVEVTFDKTSPIVYGTQLTVGCEASAGEGDGEWTLLKNGTDVTWAKDTPTVFQEGTWLFTCQISEGDNHSPAESTSSFTITTENIPPQVVISHPSQNQYYSSVSQLTFRTIDENTFEMTCNYSVDGGGSEQITAQNNTEKNVGITVTGGGQHSVSVACSDGQDWTQSTTWFYLDSTPPELSVSSPENNTRVNHALLEYSGWDENGISRYEVSKDAGQWIDNGLETEYDFTPITEGPHVLCVKAFDPVGNQNVSCVEVTYDVTPPSTQIISPSEGQTLYTNQVEVNYFVTGEWLYSEYRTESTGWQGDWDGSPVTFTVASEGQHTFYVRSVDQAGNIGASDSVTVGIDLTRPSVEITSPENHALIETEWLEVNFTTPATDELGFEYSLDGTIWQDTGINPVDFPDNQFTFNFTSLQEGLNYLYLRGYDGGGSGSPGLVIVNVSLVENLAPQVSIQHPEQGEYYSSVTRIDFTPVDDLTQNLDCEYRVDSGSWNSVTAENGQLKSVSITVSGDGYHTVRVKCFDGELWSEVKTRGFYIDSTGPYVTITSPPDDSYAQQAGFTYSGNDGSGIGLDYYLVKVDGGTWTQTTSTSHTFSGLSDGQHWLYVKGVDELGNNGQQTALNITLDTTLPYIEIVEPINGDQFPSPSVIMGCLISDETVLDRMEVKVDDGEWIVDPDGPPAYLFTDLSDGNRTLWAKAVDKAGNENTDSVWIIINSEGPDTTITSPTNGTYYEVDDVEVSFYSDDYDVDSFQYSFNGADWTDTDVTNANPGTVYTYTVQNVPEGNTTIYVRGKDTAGNLGTPAAVEVEVNSLFTNLDVCLFAPNQIPQYQEFVITFDVTNRNEEDIPSGEVQVNITFDSPTCYIVGGSNPQTLSEIETGTSEEGSWICQCSSMGYQTVTGWMIYTPDGRTKQESQVIEVEVPLAAQEEMEELELPVTKDDT